MKERINNAVIAVALGVMLEENGVDLSEIVSESDYNALTTFAGSIINGVFVESAKSLFRNYTLSIVNEEAV